jgi:hypothetical protein
MTATATRCAAIFVVLVAASCSRRATHVTFVPPPEPLSTVAVVPLRLEFSSDDYEVQLRTEDVLATLWTASSWGVVGPGEFTVRSERPQRSLLDTDLVLRAGQLGIDPKRAALLTGRVTLSETQSQAVTTGGHGGKSQDYVGEVAVRLTLFAPDGQQVIEVESRRTLDPFAEQPSSDSRPELRAALVEATEELVKSCERCFDSWPRPKVRLATNAAVILRRAGKRDELLAKGELERDEEMLPALYYFEPEMPLREAHRLFSIGGGFCLLEEGLGGLGAGACVSAINGHELDGPHAFGRALARPGTLELTVYDAGRAQPRTVSYAGRD